MLFKIEKATLYRLKKKGQKGTCVDLKEMEGVYATGPILNSVIGSNFMASWIRS